MVEAAKEDKAEKRKAEQEARGLDQSNRDKILADVYARRFSDEGAAANLVSGLDERVFPEEVCHLVPEGNGYDSTTRDGSTLNAFTMRKNIPRKVHGILDGFQTCVKNEHRCTGPSA